MVVEMVLVLGETVWLQFASPATPAAGYSNTKELGRLPYTDSVYPFELAAVVLLVAIVAAIALTLRRRKQTKYQNPSLQVRVQSQDRVRIVQMASEKRPATETTQAISSPNK